MGRIWCAGEGEYFDEDQFADDSGVVIHTGKGHTVAGDPVSFPPRNGPLGYRLSDQELGQRGQ